jgi:hypothetical protein
MLTSHCYIICYVRKEYVHKSYFSPFNIPNLYQLGVAFQILYFTEYYNNELGYNKLPVIRNIFFNFFNPKFMFTTLSNPVITNPGSEEQIWSKTCLL